MFGSQLFDREQADAFPCQRRPHRFVPAAILGRHQFLGALGDFLQLADRPQSVGAVILRGAVAEGLFAQAGYADHEEFVEVGAENGEEFQPLQQRRALVFRFLEHAGIELQPAKLAVDEQFGRECLLVHRCRFLDAHHRPTCILGAEAHARKARIFIAAKHLPADI